MARTSGFSLAQSPGDVSTSFSGPGSGFHPGMLQNLLKWKMDMAEEMQRAKLAEMRMQMRLAQGQARLEQGRQRGEERQTRLAQIPQRRETPRGTGGRKFDPFLEKWKIASSPSGRGPDFDRMRREQALQMMMTGGAGGSGFAADPAALQKQALSAVETPEERDPNAPDPSRGRGDYRVPFRGSTFLGAGSSRETGGGIPEDGWYYLHQDEDVIPAPKTLKEMMVNRLQPGSPRTGYQTGTPRANENLYELMARIFSGPIDPDQERRNLEAAYATEPGLEMPMDFGEEMGVPEPPGPPGPPSDTGGNLVAEAQERRQMIADPDVHPQEALDLIASERERIKGPGGQAMDQGRPEEMGIEGLEVTESPISERRSTSMFGEEHFTRPETSQETVKSYKLDQTPRSPEEAQGRKVEQATQAQEKEQAEIDRLYEAANSHASYAANLLDYAGQNTGSPAYENLRTMASDRLALAQEIERVASVRKKQIDMKQAALGEQQAKVTASQIEAGGRVGAAQAGAQGRAAGAGVDRQRMIMDNLRHLVSTYAGIEGGDPEEQAQMVQEMLNIFMTMGGLQEGLAGGLPDGG